MFGRATIRLGIGPHSSLILTAVLTQLSLMHIQIFCLHASKCYYTAGANMAVLQCTSAYLDDAWFTMNRVIDLAVIISHQA